MNANKMLWEKGDFTQIAATMRESGADLVSKLGITKGMKVLDIGCGDGTTAIPAAKTGAIVSGVDIAENLVAAGNQRILLENVLHCSIRQGDAIHLEGVDDDSFDMTISIFGAMFAPKPYEVAKEMVRVTRPGGRIVMGNWIPGDPTLVAQILKTSSAYTPPPPEGFVSPMLWGVEDEVADRFGNAGIARNQLSFLRDTYVFQAPFSPAELVERFRHFYGPTMNAFEAAEKNGLATQLQDELTRLFVSQNKSGSADTTYIPATFLRVTVTV